jgi:hypothetical protein
MIEGFFWGVITTILVLVLTLTAAYIYTNWKYPDEINERED